MAKPAVPDSQAVLLQTAEQGSSATGVKCKGPELIPDSVVDSHHSLSERSSEPECPICLGRSILFFAQGSDRLFGLAQGTFHLLRCLGCGCIFQNPIPPLSVLSSFYPHSYWWGDRTSASGARRSIKRLEEIYREFVAADHIRFLVRIARKEKNSGRELLDIGCGSGTLLHLARRRGFRPHGMDVSARAVALALEMYGLEIERGNIGDDLWPGLRFDFITMFHVLEHLENPLSALEYAAGLLKPEGNLIIQVPNIQSIQARVFGKRWYGLDVPRHIINFSRKALALLLGKAGFDIKAVARFSLRDNPASIASSLAPGLDPIGRRGRKRNVRPLTDGLLEFAYLSLFALSLPFALVESAFGRGGTIWVHAKKRPGSMG